MAIGFKPWKSDVSKGWVVLTFFSAGVYFGTFGILAPAGIMKINEMGYWTTSPYLLTFLLFWQPTLMIYVGLKTLNKEFIWKGE